MVYRDQENYPAAVETFRKMIPLGDDNTRTGYQDVIDTYREAKQWPEATAARKKPRRNCRTTARSAWCWMRNWPTPAIPKSRSATCARCSKARPKIARFTPAVHYEYTRLHRWSDAEEALNKAEQLSTKAEDKEYVYFLRGSTYEREKKYRRVRRPNSRKCWHQSAKLRRH